MKKQSTAKAKKQQTAARDWRIKNRFNPNAGQSKNKTKKTFDFHPSRCGWCD